VQEENVHVLLVVRSCNIYSQFAASLLYAN